MTDAQLPDQQVQSNDHQTQSERDGSDRGRLGRALAIVAVAAVVILVFLMLRGCSLERGTRAGDDSAKEIVPVEGLAPAVGIVSVWVAESTKADAVLSMAGLSEGGITDMGGGRFVIEVPVGSEQTTVERLKRTDGVIDAGRVYESTAK